MKMERRIRRKAKVEVNNEYGVNESVISEPVPSKLSPIKQEEIRLVDEACNET